MISHQQQQLYIILDDWELGFSIRKVDLELDQVILGGRKAREDATRLPPAIIRFSARRESPICFSVSFGSKILAMQPKEESNPDMGGFCFDVHERSLSYIPRHSHQLRPVYFPIGDKLFVIGRFSMELLDMQPLASPSGELGALSWRKLPDAPFNSIYVISRAVLLDRKTIFVSVDITLTTYSFDMAEDGSFEWETLGKWILPFDGCGYFNPELDTWVGLSLYREKPGHICSCNLAFVTSECCPEVKYSKECLFTEDPTEEHLGASLVYMGGHKRKFCLVECIVVGNKDERPSHLGKKNMDPPHVHMFRLTKFSLKLDENGDLTTGDSRQVRYYKVPSKEINKILFLWPQVFWL